MADEIQRVQYFYTEVPDKPGEGARVLNALKGEEVDLLAYVAFPKGRRAQIDFIPTDQAAFKVAAKKAKIKLVGPKTGFVIQGEDRAGAVAEIVSGQDQHNSASRCYGWSWTVWSDTLGQASRCQ